MWLIFFIVDEREEEEERETIKRHLEESRTEREESRLEMARAKEVGEWERVAEIARDRE